MTLPCPARDDPSPLPTSPAVSATATACQGRGRDGPLAETPRVPYLGRQLREARTLASYSERRYPRAKFVQEVSRGILDSEMAINEETLEPTIAEWPDQLPGQFAHVDALLNEAA